MKIKLLCILILTIFYLPNTFGHNVDIKILKELNATLYSLYTPKDTITFIKTDTNTTLTKPTLLFCQGSMPIPLIISYKRDEYYFALFNFDYEKIAEKYNLIIIAMPHTPAVAKVEQLNSQSLYVPDTSHPELLDKSYSLDNYLDKYVERANQVISYVLSQSWAYSDSLYVFGHSQGAVISVEIARTNEKVKAIAYSSGNPDGRATGEIKKIRNNVAQKKITQEEAQVQLSKLYAWWKDICTSKKPNNYAGDLPQTWQSFSISHRDALAHLKIPVFIAYGTEDVATASGCELMPIYFELNHKTNYQMYPVVGGGHNFEEFTDNGKPNYEKMHWQEVMDHFIEFIK